MVRRAWILVLVVAAVATAWFAPLPVVLGGNRLVVFALLATGAWITLGRAGLVDLATGAVAGVGAYLGGVTAGLVGFPMLLGLLCGTTAGAVTGAFVAAVGGRVGRTLSALTSLALAAAAVTLFAVLPGAGGGSGFHAVPLLTGHDRVDLVALLVLAAVAVVVARWFDTSVAGARAAVALDAPAVAASLGRPPAFDAGVAGAVAGAVLGLAGAAGAAVTGSVAPGAYGLRLSAGLALAVLVGGAHPLAGAVGALIVWGPSIIWPTAPIVGDAPLLVMGLAGLGLLWVRAGGLLPRSGQLVPTTSPDPPTSAGATLSVTDAKLPGGRVDLEVLPGEVVALVGPNGSGKSTLLARIGGQLDDAGTVRIDGAQPPHGAVARARRGVARSWQRVPGLDQLDAERVVTTDVGARAAVAWAREVLGEGPGADQLVLVAARRPALALLDEPASDLPPDRVARFVRGLAAGGAAVLVVEHRPELVTEADRIVHLGGDP
ncbi:MAG: ATP-binding cassette domain-containing protein [Actinobacteria bacterium]|nr:ATP-binding cassette domain-containing protein [Actinomycetota bacterium]